VKAVKKPKAPRLLKWGGGHIEYDVKLLGIFTKYDTAIKYIDTVNFKSYTVILLNSLKEIIGNTIIDSEIAKLKTPTVLKDKQEEIQEEILSNIKQTYIDPYLTSVRDENNNITGVIKTAEFTNKYAEKIKLDKQDETNKANYEWSKKQERAIAKYDETVASNSIRDAGDKARQALNNRRGNTGMGRDYSLVSNSASSGWDTGAVEFGPTTYTTVRADIGVASRNTPEFTTTRGSLTRF
jgi:hypothetical protein